MQIEEIVNAIVSGYSRDSLQRMLRCGLGKKLDDLVGPGGNLKVVSELVQLSEDEGWTHELVREAYRYNNGNPQLVQIYQKYGLATFADLQKAGTKVSADVPVTDAGFELAVKATIPHLDSAVFRSLHEKMETRVCRIELNGTALKGTGFLVGPSAVLTNYHVMRTVIDKPALAKDVRVRFDFKVLTGGTPISGSVVGLADDWDIDHSMFSPAEDKATTPGSPLPTPDQLDYALIRLNQPVGDLALNSAAPTGLRRGWIKIRDVQPSISPKMPLMILHHPEGAPLKLTFDTDAVIGFNDNQTRVRYTTNTDRGSSGSPCFDLAWSIIALHHYGDASFGHPPFNQGVPINLVAALLQARGKEGNLGGDPP